MFETVARKSAYPFDSFRAINQARGNALLAASSIRQNNVTLFIWGDKMKDRFDAMDKTSAFSLDDILKEAAAGSFSAETAAEQPSHLWSMEEIETLLSSGSKSHRDAAGLSLPEPEENPKPTEPESAPPKPAPEQSAVSDTQPAQRSAPAPIEPPLPPFEETDESSVPAERPSSESIAPPAESPELPAPQPEPLAVPEGTGSDEERFAQLERTLTPVTGMQGAFDPKASAGDLLGAARENWSMPAKGEPLLGGDKYRDRFFREPTTKIRIEPQQGQAQLIDKPGLIRKKSGLSATADLEPLPTLISAEDEIDAAIDQEKTREVGSLAAVKPSPIIPDAPPAKDMVDGQLLLAGFDEKEEPAASLDEEQAQQLLQESRKEKIRKFKLAAVEEPDFSSQDALSPPDPASQSREENPSVKAKSAPIGEYTSPSQKIPLRALLRRRANLEMRCAFVSAALELALILCGILPQAVSFFQGEGEALLFFSADQKLYVIVHLLVLAGVCLASLPVIRSGLRALLRFKCRADTGAAAAALAALLQNVCFLFFSPGPNVPAHLFGAAAGLTLTLSMFGKALHAKSIAKNFQFCTQEAPLYTVQKISDEEDAYEIGRGLLLGDPDVRYSTRTAFPSRFRALSEQLGPADRLSAKLVPVVLALSTATGIAVGILNRSAADGFSALAAFACISIPAVLSLGAAWPLFRANQSLNRGGAMVSGYAAAADCGETNAVVFDSSDIFRHGGCNIHGFKPFHGMRIDEAILDAASLVIAAGGPLGEVFDSVILGNRRILPPVEELSYEDRMGLSGWVHGRRILVGNRELLQHHNVELPPRQSEAKYRHDGRQVMYLAVDGLLSALFVVSYQADPHVGEHLKNLERKGITILVRTSDPNITDSFVEERFGLPQNCVKVISAQAGVIYRKYRSTALQRGSAGIVHDGRIQNFLRSVAACATLQNGAKLLTALEVAAAALGAALVGVLCFTSEVSVLGAVQIILYQLFWAVIILAIGGSEKF